MKIDLAKSEIIHFIGIGGIGMSGLALIMHSMGFKIQGSDMNLNKNIERLKKKKIKIFIGHGKINIKNATVLVISSAIKKNNPELIEGKIKSLPIYKRGEMLGHISSLTKNITVVGSHGKTTTTSLIASIFSKTKIDPTIINGGVLNSLDSSARLGNSNWSILELDESDGSFLQVMPTYSIITNIDREHMDYYKNMENLKDLFKKFLEKIPSFGKSFICFDDKINREIIKKIKIKNFYTYGIHKNCNFYINNVSQNKNFSKFDIKISLPGKKKYFIKNIKIPILGMHNIRNATAAVAVALTIGISKKFIKNGLLNFKGVQRRFNKIFTFNGAEFYDDYAHHPTEIKEVLNGVREAYDHQKIICIFQPHRISRLKDLKKEFTLSFKKADQVVLCPIFSAGEKIKLGFKYYDFAKLLAKNSNVKTFLVHDKNNLAKFVKQNIRGNKIVIGMGAGSISNWIKELPNIL